MNGPGLWNHPSNAHKYVVCQEDGRYGIMNCPDNLVFVQEKQICDWKQNDKKGNGKDNENEEGDKTISSGKS